MQELDQCKSMGADGLHPGMPRELADAVVMLLCTIFEKLWRSGKSLTTGEGQMLHPSSKKASQPYFSLRKMIRQSSSKCWPCEDDLE